MVTQICTCDICKRDMSNENLDYGKSVKVEIQDVYYCADEKSFYEHVCMHCRHELLKTWIDVINRLSK